MSRRVVLPAILMALAVPGIAHADSVVLKSGQVIEADLAWFEGQELRYRRDGTVYSVPRSLVARVEAADGGALEDPDVRLSRQRREGGGAPRVAPLVELLP